MVAAALTGAFSSCSDFLEEDNKTGMTADITYSTKSGIDGLVNSCYAYTRGWWSKEAGLGLTECGSDLFLGGYDNKQTSLVTYNFTPKSLDGNTSDDACFDHYWEMFYNAIDVCNNALVYIPKNTVLDEKTKAQYTAEVLFLRALYYSQMVATWGPIPYNTDPVASVTTNPVRVPEAVVYKNILTDIDEAIKNFETAGVASKVKAGDTKASRAAAVALKARVALYAASWLGANSVEGYGNLYEVAQNAAEDAIAHSDADFYERYADTWNMNNENVSKNKEAIWGVHFNEELNTDNCIPYRYKTDNNGNHKQFNSLITRTGYSRGGSAMLLMFVSMWSNGLTKEIAGGSKPSADFLFYRITAAATNYQLNKNGDKITADYLFSPYGRGFTRYLPSLYLWRTLEGIKTTDQRADATLLTHYNIPDGIQGNVAKLYPNMGQFMVDPTVAYAKDKNYFNSGDTAIYYSSLDGDSEEGKALQAWAKGRYRLQFATGGDIPVYDVNDMAKAIPTKVAKAKSDVYGDDRYNNVNVGGWKSYPGIKKFLDDQYDYGGKNLTHDISPRDFIVFRLAEMYLIKAECQLAKGDAEAAKKTLNDLREVRAIDGMKEANKIKGTVDIETILEERAIELCGEQQRWFDLKRTHTLVDHVKKYNGAAAANVAVKHYYRPIPEEQMESCTNVIETKATQDANGVLQYKETDNSGFWQNPGY